MVVSARGLAVGQVSQIGTGETNQQKWNAIFLETSWILSIQDPMVCSAYKLPAWENEYKL